MSIRLLAVLVALTSATAAAQTVTYTRPSKGKTLTVFTNFSLDVSLAYQDSAVFDWTAFTAIQIRVSVSNTPSACSNTPRVLVSGATEPGGVFLQESDPASQTDIDGSAAAVTYTVGNLSPYIKLRIGAMPGIGMASCVATVTVVPFPVDQTFRSVGGIYSLTDSIKLSKLNPSIGGGVRLGPPATFSGDYNPFALTAVNSVSFSRYDQNSTMLTTNGTSAPPLTIVPPVTVGGGAEVEVFNIGDLNTLGQDSYVKPTNITVENTGTAAAFCAFVSVPPLALPIPAVSPVNYSFILKAAAVAGDGTGGSRTFYSIIRPYSAIRCITAGGATAVAVQAF